MPEREERLPGQVEIVIAAARRLVVVRERQLAFLHREGDRQASRRIGVAEEHARDGRSALLARVPGHEHRSHLLEPGRHRDRAPADDHDRRRDAGRRDGADERLLVTGQREARTIAELALLDAGDDHRHIARARDRDRLGDPRRMVLRYARVPDELHARIAGALEVVEPDGVPASGCERDGHEPRAERALLPGIDHQAAIDPEAVAVVALHADPREPARGRDEGAGPADGVPVIWYALPRRAERPAEVDALVGATDARRTGERVVGPVLAPEPSPGGGAILPLEIRGRHYHMSGSESRRAAGEAHRGLPPGPFADRIEHRDRRDAGPGVAAEAHGVGVGPDHRDPADALL
jgi:hypothetical protein